MLKTRSAVEHAEALSVLGAHRDAHVPLVLASAFHASDLRSALLLERAAFAFIRGESAMIHKFASYMVLAGARYVRAGAFPAATRCYAFALPPTADDASWNAAQEHLNTPLGRLVANAGHTRTAMEFYREATRRATHLPADAQKTRARRPQPPSPQTERTTRRNLPPAGQPARGAHAPRHSEG